MVKVTYNGNEYKVAKNTKVIDFMKNTLKIKNDNVIACKAFYEIKSLNFELDRDTNLELIDTTTQDGSRIYVRGLTFILIKAFEELFPGKKLIVNYALGHTLYCDSPDVKLKQSDIKLIKEKMNEIISANIPFEKRILTLDEAMNLYEKER